MSLRAFFLAGLATRAPGTVLALVAGEREAEDLRDDLGLFTENVALLPPWETLPFEHVSPNLLTMATRARARHTLEAGPRGAVVVASVRAAIQRLSPSSFDPITVSTTGELGFDALVDGLASYGYQRTDRVENRGDFAVRGGIIDVAPAQGGDPVRIEFWGDQVTDMRRFSTVTQRSTGPAVEVVAYPARELRSDAVLAARAAGLAESHPWASATWERISQGVFFAGMESWLPWLAPERTVLSAGPDETWLVAFEDARLLARSSELQAEERDLAAALASTWGEGAPVAGEHPELYLPLSIEQALVCPPGS
ncbi:MAG TPA: transcription-repair coupling factor, partial [Acidimicrobiia bacterium]